MTPSSHRASLRAILALVVALALSITGLPDADAADHPQRIDLRLLLVAETGDEPAIQQWAATLSREGVPFDLVALASAPEGTSALPPLTEGTDHARYQGVILADAYLPGLSAEDEDALWAFEATFGLREAIAYAWPNPTLGLSYPTESGDLAGSTWSVTAAGAEVFPSLTGSVPIRDTVWGYRSTPLDDRFTTLVGDADGNALVGVHTRDDGVERLVVTVDGNESMTHARILAHDLVAWVTQGVRLGHQRAYLAVHVDDVFLPDARWSIEGNCTPLDDCPPDVPLTEDIRMTAADVARAVDWQRHRGVVMTMAFNGAGTAEAVAEHGTDPLTDAFVANRHEFAWINHTFDHEYLGCIQDFTVVPWQCATDESGNTLWYSKDDLKAQIEQNVKFADAHGLSIDERELVTGEHSGLRALPQMPTDNPFLAQALDDRKVRYIASDASREGTPRPIGTARTSPRYPNNIFYNVATEAELVDEYNWIYLPEELGGTCVDTATTTCRSWPASFAEIVDIEARIMLQHVTGNDPRSTYMHQSNLAEDGVAYPLLDAVLDRYDSWFTPPLVQPTLTETTERLDQMDRYRDALAAGLVTAYRIGNEVFLDAPKGVEVPITLPAGSTKHDGKAFGELYGGERSDWRKVGKDLARFLVP